MGFIDDLKKGLPGLKLDIPDTWRRQEEQERRAILVDTEHQVGWHLLYAPWRLDLRSEHADLLRRELVRHTRYGFEQHYAQAQPPAAKVQPGQTRAPVRTSDPEFNPLISSEMIEIDGQPVLQTIRRVAYEPSLEAVVGNLLIPISTGLIDITVFQHTQDTGYRENGLLNLAMQKYPGEGPQKLAKRLGQSHFDDPQYDAQYPKHPLTCVRAALRWLRELPKERFAILAPALPLPPIGAEIELPTSGCAVRLPPRYTLVPEGVLPTPVGVTLMSRVILEGADDPQMLDVRQIAGLTLAPEDRPAKLDALVQRQIEEWKRQGATDLETKQAPIELPVIAENAALGPRIGLAADVTMSLGGVRTHAVSRWIVDHDGRVFRIGVAAPPYVPMAEAAADADAVLRSFRRLPPKKVSTAWLTSDLRLAPLKRASADPPASAR